MKKYEIEALIKSFLLFFLLQSLVLWLIYTQTAHKEKEKYDTKLLNHMKLCSYTLKCKEFDFDFVDKKSQDTTKLYKTEDEVYALFSIPNSNSFYLKIFFPAKRYQEDLQNITKTINKEFLPYILLLFVLSFLFAIYSLYPLKKALRLNDEFIKDILHDYNTPISSLLINFKLFKKEIGENKKLLRMQKSIDTMLSLQNNLKYFLQNSQLQNDTFSLKSLLQDRINFFNSLYPDISFKSDIKEYQLHSNKDAFLRIIDNLLSNACKHNIPNGYVLVLTKENSIIIENSSKEIQNPDKLFQRFYKEDQRGLGLGLNIVKKLSTQLNIDISVKKEKDKTIFVLKLDKVIFS